jgi:DDE superfamily endonuclease
VSSSYCFYPACLLRQLRTRACDCSIPRVYTHRCRLLYNQVGCDIKAGLELTQKSYIIGPEEKKDARVLMNTNREWATLIETISAIGKALKPFFINKGAQVLRDLMKAMVKSKATLAVTHNKWSNDEMALEYLKHFHRHARPVGVFRLLILDGHDSHATFRFKELAHEYKIILLYLPAHITHKLQPLDVGIFEPQSGFYSTPNNTTFSLGWIQC